MVSLFPHLHSPAPTPFSPSLISLMVSIETMFTYVLPCVMKLAFPSGACSWRPDPTVRHSVWALFFGAMVGQLTIYAANQTMIQRYLAIKEIHNSQKWVCVVTMTIWWSSWPSDPRQLVRPQCSDTDHQANARFTEVSVWKQMTVWRIISWQSMLPKTDHDPAIFGCQGDPQLTEVSVWKQSLTDY